MNTDDIKVELKQKERYVSDLLRFIETRTDNNPNYSLLLGSGCSVTSNIRSGGELINEWRKEIFNNLIKYDEKYKENEYSTEEATNYLTKNCGSWYNKTNEYSSLFEKKYDLPRQRRMFVEKEVSDKTPSIGYAYLINLIKDSYFNTIFTTNFDDLINEAFYQFSEYRPIICAHDSSINSITVTSKRPKIIKLHGDYLFDDIKSTLRETESLEDNIRNKFIEFSKDYGLIVVGYGGHDRSIMDVINYLLKHEDYYKNGIYWCLRKGDIIGEELRKLLWKDKVYFVEIDGFDELFAKLHNKIYRGKLPIDTNFISSKSQDIIQKFIENKSLQKTSSDIILKDLQNLENQNERNNFYETIKQMQSNKDFGDDKLENKEVKILIELGNLAKQDQYDEMIHLVNNTLNNTNNKDFKIELYRKLIIAYSRLNDEYNAIQISNKLIDIDSNNPVHFINKANLVTSFDEKINLINNSIELDSYYEDFYNKKILLLIERYDGSQKNQTDFNEIINLCNKSIEINPSIKNSAWSLKFDFLLENNNKDKELSEIIAKLEKQGPYTIDILQMKYDLLSTNEEKNDFLNIVKEAKNKYLHDNKLEYELLILGILKKINDKDKIMEQIELIELNSLYKKDSLYLKNKAIVFLEKFNKLDESISILEESLKIKRNNNTIKLLITYLLHSKNIIKAKEILEQYNFILSKNDKLNLQKDIYDKEEDYINAYKKVEELQVINNYKSHNYISSLSYFLLQQNKYEDVKNMLKDYLEKRNYNLSLEPEIINYEFACKQLNATYKVNKTRLEGIKAKTTSESTKAAIHALENKDTEVFKNLKKQLEKNCSSKYEFEKWPVFWSLKDDARFKAIFNS